MISAIIVVWVGTWIEEKMRVDDTVGAVAVHGFTGFLGIIWVGVFAAGYPTGLNNVESSIVGPADRDRASSCRSASSRAGSRRGC